jgi:hypothetical protein
MVLVSDLTPDVLKAADVAIVRRLPTLAAATAVAAAARMPLPGKEGA